MKKIVVGCLVVVGMASQGLVGMDDSAALAQYFSADTYYGAKGYLSSIDNLEPGRSPNYVFLGLSQALKLYNMQVSPEGKDLFQSTAVRKFNSKFRGFSAEEALLNDKPYPGMFPKVTDNLTPREKLANVKDFDELLIVLKEIGTSE